MVTEGMRAASRRLTSSMPAPGSNPMATNVTRSSWKFVIETASSRFA
jgi:hypothetical protein